MSAFGGKVDMTQRVAMPANHPNRKPSQSTATMEHQKIGFKFYSAESKMFRRAPVGEDGEPSLFSFV